MSFNVANRRVHYWIAFGAGLPALVIIASGLLLQLKKHWSWVQPAEFRGTGTTPQISLQHIFEAVASEPGMNVRAWNDVNRVDLRPGRGVAKVWLHSGWEVQVDLGTGRVLHTAYRRSDLIESMHDGSFFAGDWTKLGVFLPAGVALLALWVTGLRMWWVPFAAKRRRAAGLPAAPPPPSRQRT
jgi:hypothetical protein